MEVKELQQKSVQDLKRTLDEKREKLRELRFNLASGKVKNVRELREIKKDIARILTVINRDSGRKNSKIINN